MAKDGGAYGTWDGLMAGGLGARCSLSGGEAVRARDPWLLVGSLPIGWGQKRWSVRWWGRKRIRALVGERRRDRACRGGRRRWSVRFVALWLKYEI